MALLECIIVEPRQTARASVIWLHGLGADGHDFEPIVPELTRQYTVPTRFVFPHAPYRLVTLNQGYRMRAWYDLASLDFDSEPDFPGIQLSVSQITALIEEEHRLGRPYERILLAGFSQGGVIALQGGLNFPHRLAGIAALSTYFPVPTKSAWTPNPANANTPIFMAHGTDDNVVKTRFGEYSRDFLMGRGCQIDWHSYPMAHSVCPEEIDDIARWLSTLTS